MKRVVKTIFKPFLVLFVFPAVGVLAIVKKVVVALHLKNQHKNLAKLNKATLKLYALVFNPYRICNGIRPNFLALHNPAAANIEKCHEMFRAKRQRAAEGDRGDYTTWNRSSGTME